MTGGSPITNDFVRWLEVVEPTLLPSDPLMDAVRYYTNHRDALFRFIDDPDVPIDNSPTEREFQNVAKLRLPRLFGDSPEGAHRASVLLGIIATCRALGVPAQAASGATRGTLQIVAPPGFADRSRGRSRAVLRAGEFMGRQTSA